MLAISGTIDNVAPSQFIVSGDFVFVLRRDDIKCTLIGYQAGKKRWEKNIEGELSIGFAYNNAIIIDDYKKRLLQVDIVDGAIVKEIEGDFAPVRSIRDYFLISIFLKDAYYPALYSSEFKQLWQLKTLPFFYQLTNVDRLLGFPKSKSSTEVDYAFFTLYDIDSGEEKWSHDISEYSPWIDFHGKRKDVEVSKFLGVFREDLWVALNNGKILILNVQTGERKHVIGNPHFSYPFEKNVFPSTDDMVMDNKNSRVVGLFMHSHWEVDLETFNVNHVYLEDHFDEFKIHSSGVSAIDDAFIYFVDKDNGKVGVFNRGTHRLAWQYAFPQPGDLQTFPLSLQKHGDTIYVLDSDDTLHIFKKTV
jgi:outer membrane protein assembly factor BamB